MFANIVCALSGHFLGSFVIFMLFFACLIAEERRHRLEDASKNEPTPASSLPSWMRKAKFEDVIIDKTAGDKELEVSSGLKGLW